MWKLSPISISSMLEPWLINAGTLAYQYWNPALSMLEPSPIYKCCNPGLPIVNVGTLVYYVETLAYQMLEPSPINVGTLAYQCWNPRLSSWNPGWNPGLSMLELKPINVRNLAYQC